MNPALCPELYPGDVLVLQPRGGVCPAVWKQVSAGGTPRLEVFKHVPPGAWAMVLDTSQAPWLFTVLCDGAMGLARTQEVLWIERGGVVIAEDKRR